MSENNDEFTYLGGMFWKGNDKIYCEGRPLRGADADSFVHIFENWAKDKNHVFSAHWKCSKANPQTFSPINSMYGKDDKAVFINQFLLKGADPKTFVALDAGKHFSGRSSMPPSSGGYSRDCNSVYYVNNIARKADPKTFISLGNSYGKDDNHVFLERLAIPKANPHHWYYVSQWYSVDEKSVFYLNKIIKGADPKTFVRLWPLEHYYSKDINYYYRCGEITTEDKYHDDLSKYIIKLQDTEKIIEDGSHHDYFKLLNNHFSRPDEIANSRSGKKSQ